MGQYYFLAAQLPYLVYGQVQPMSSDAFRAMARAAMSSADAAALDYCTLDPFVAAPAPESGFFMGAPPPSTGAGSNPPVHSAFINKWREWEQALRLNLAGGRLQKLKRDGAAADAPDSPVEAAAAAKNALAMESPLEAELYLDKARWNAIEGFQGLSTFSEDAMYAYLLKLLLMERKAAFNTEEGYTEYERLYSAILGEAK